MDVVEWIYEFMSIVDMTTNLNELDTRLQGQYHLIDSVFDHVMAFEMDLGNHT